MKFVKISEIAHVNPQTPKSISQNKEQSVSFIPMASVTESAEIVCTEVKDIQEVIKGYRYFERGDVLLAKITPCMENGKAAYVSNIPTQVGFGSTEFHVLRPYSNIDGRYLFYMVWNPYFRHAAKLNMTGTAGQQRVPTDFLKRFEIPLPPIAQQKRIATILDKADAVRRKRREAIRLTEELLRSTFLEMFGDPITNPKGWDMKSIGNLCTVVRGGSPRPIESFLGGTVPWIKIGDATKGDELYIEKTEEFIREEGVKNSRYLEPGSLIFANCGVSLGFARVLKIGGCIHDGWLALSDIDPSLNKFFLLRLINSITNHFRAIAPDGTQPNLNTSIIKNFKIPVPPLKLQEEFCAILFRQVNVNSKNLESLDSLEHLFNSLLQRAFTGNL